MKDQLTVKHFVLGPLQTNCYLLFGEATRKAVLIDPAVPSQEVASEINNRALEVVCTVNTHGHADHISGNASFGFPVAIHESDVKCLTEPEESLSRLLGSPLTVIEDFFTVTDGDVIAEDLSIRVLHTPGHTPGSISLLAGDMLFSGDTLFRESIGRSDLPGGDQAALVRSIRDKLFLLPEDTLVLPGHGESTTIGHEKFNNPFLGAHVI